MKEIQKNIELEKIKQRVNYIRNEDQVSSLESFKRFKAYDIKTTSRFIVRKY
ncbi:hypothetical protein ACVPOR_13995 [Staphylococcus aureus]